MVLEEFNDGNTKKYLLADRIYGSNSMTAKPGYKMTELGNVIELAYGNPLPQKSRVPGAFPVFGSNGKVGTHKDFVVEGPGIIVGRKGSAGLVSWSDKNFWPIDTTYFVNPRDSSNLRWIYYMLKFLRLEKIASTTGVPGLNRDDAYEQLIYLPEPMCQQKIALILSSIDTTLERSRAVLEQVEEVRRAVMQELMTRGEVTTLGELAAKKGMQTGPFGGQLHAYEYTETGIPVVMPQDLTLARILERKIARVPQAIADRLERHKLQLNDIVFSRRGNLGRFGLVGELEVGWLCGTGCLRFRPGPSVDSGYLIRFLQRQETIDWLHGNAVGQTMPNLNTAILSELPIVIPDITEQKRISGVFDSLDKRIRTELSKISQLERIKQDLMHLLLTGQKRVNV
jgi:type I restriction enzyme, S subunit